MRKMAIPLGLALALGVLQNFSVGQTPAQKLDTTPQTPSISAVARNPTKAQSDKSTQNQDRNWQLKLGPVLVGASYRRFGDPFYYPYGLSPFDGFYRVWLWDPYWAYPVSYPSGYFGYDDRKVVETELDEKGLPEGAVMTPVAGYLYFPLAKKAKNARYELEYVLNGNKVVLRLAE